MDRIRYLSPAMTDLAQPKAAHAVDVFVSLGVPQSDPFATDKFSELLLIFCWLGVWV
jgi:hypothetical protein